MRIVQIKSHFTLAVVLFALLMGAAIAWTNKDNLTSAADARKFNAGNIMSDFVMTNKGSMSEMQIQEFLLSKNSCNDRNIGKAATYPHLQYNIRNGKFVCLAEESFNGESAARIIWQAGQDYNINPQVLIVLLEKEQGLITDTWPNHIQYRSATGYGCPDTADCDGKYYGFKNQVRNAANFFKAYQTGNTGWYKLVWPGNKYTGSWQPFSYDVQLHPNAACGSISTRIENRATASLYSYTPYRPNQAALNAQSGHGDNCSSYGNRNFWMFFNDWFGDTQGVLHNGVDYSPVFNSEYYLSNNVDLKSKYTSASDAFGHFVAYGMAEGRQASASFNATSYKNRYGDLRALFRGDLPSYYRHFSLYGQKEGREGSGNATLNPVTKNGAQDYSAVYKYETYLDKNPDLKRRFSNDDIGALEHFIHHGMNESRVAIDSFDVSSYMIGYRDLRLAFGDSPRLYYLHFINNGKSEGRIAVNNPASGVSSLDGRDYAEIYSFDFYRNKYGDVKRSFTTNDMAALRHFIAHGMNEGRQASQSFDVIVYKDRYIDLQRVFGDNLGRYYIHYIEHGKDEGRSAT